MIEDFCLFTESPFTLVRVEASCKSNIPFLWSFPTRYEHDMVTKINSHHVSILLILLMIVKLNRGFLCQYLEIVTQGKWRVLMSSLKVIYEKTKNIDAVRRLLGHSSVTATSSYIGVTDNSALDLARTYSF